MQFTGNSTLLRGRSHLFAATRMLHPGLLPTIPGRTKTIAAAIGARAQPVLHQPLVLLVSFARYEISSVRRSPQMGLAKRCRAFKVAQSGPSGPLGICYEGGGGYEYEYYYWQQRWPLTELRQVESRPYASRGPGSPVTDRQRDRE